MLYFGKREETAGKIVNIDLVVSQRPNTQTKTVQYNKEH